MKISELQAQLEAIKQKDGDLFCAVLTTLNNLNHLHKFDVDVISSKDNKGCGLSDILVLIPEER